MGSLHDNTMIPLKACYAIIETNTHKSQSKNRLLSQRTLLLHKQACIMPCIYNIDINVLCLTSCGD